MRDDSETSSPPSVVRRCLMLTPPGCDAPYDLLDGLRRKQVAVREVTDAPAAMAELAASPTQYMAIVVIEPQRTAQAPALMDAVARYFPAVVRWQYRRDQPVRLTVWQSNGHAAAVVPNIVIPATPPPPAVLAALGTPVVPRPVSDEQALRAAAELTEEELAMLLDDPSDAARREGLA